MILSDLYIHFRREPVPITAEERATLAREGARGYSDATTRGLPRVLARLKSALYTLVLLVACAGPLHWSASALLGFVLVNAMVTVIVDALRIRLASRWVYYSHSREYRTNEMLLVARGLECGSTSRQAQPSAWHPKSTFLAAVTCTVVVLPGVWFLLSSMGGARWHDLFGQRWLPLILGVTTIWRIARGLRRVLYTKRAAVGFNDLCLDSDDVLDTYALTLLLALPLLPFGSSAWLALAFLVVVVRVAYRAYVYWWHRQSLHMLSRWLARPQSRQHESHG